LSLLNRLTHILIGIFPDLIYRAPESAQGHNMLLVGREGNG
jgi:hypothetical protein